MLGAIIGLPATATATPISSTYATWETLRAPDTDRIRFMDGVTFLYEHPGWPDEKTIRLRAEAAALFERPTRDAMTKFCVDFPPISGRGMVACANAGVGDAAKQTGWIKQGWEQGDFNEDEEKRILAAHGDTLTKSDHVARMERLLYEGKSAGAKRMMAHMPADKRSLYNVRMAFMTNAKNAPHLLNTLPAVQQREVGILFERLRWRMKRGDDNLAELLALAPKETPYPEQWWPMRASVARSAIFKRQYSEALAAINHHGALTGEDLAEALWLKGWINLRHKDDAATAYKQFFKLYTSVSTPVSKARAAYWAARAADKNGNPEIAREWKEKAARYPTVFYGQLAHAQLHPKAPLALPAMPEITSESRTQFARDERVTVAKALAATGDARMRDMFLTALATSATSDGQFAFLANFGREIGGPATGIEVAKLALRQGTVLLDTGWPRISLPKDLPIASALTLAITRQESEFNPDARSSANAQGLMQLLPSTAKQVAKKIGMPYSNALLTEPNRNLTLGSTYLRQMIDGFDGSYILGIASYNAGPGNVRRWIAARGTPPKNLDGAIDWIESIPFGETRNYVMRVIENVGVYRTLENREAPLIIAQDLVR